MDRMEPLIIGLPMVLNTSDVHTSHVGHNMYIHYPVDADPGLGCSQIPWVCTIQVHPSWRLQVDWICSGLAGGVWVPWVEGGRSLLQMILHGPGLAEIHSTPASFAWHNLSTTAMWQIRHDPLYTQLSLVRHKNFLWIILSVYRGRLKSPLF